MPKPEIWTHGRNWSLVGKGEITAGQAQREDARHQLRKERKKSFPSVCLKVLTISRIVGLRTEAKC